MQYSFNKYLESRDLHEGWRDWFGFGGPKTVARDLTPNLNRTTGDWFSRLQARDNPPPTGVQVQQPQSTKFNAAYLNNIANTAEQYISMIGNFAKIVRGWTNDPGTQKIIANTFKQMVIPHLQRLHDWILWAKTTASQKREWDENDEILIEAIKVNYRNFENAGHAMQNIIAAMRNWVNSVKQIPQLAPYANRIQNIFNNKVLTQSGEMAKVFQSMGAKVAALMQRHGMQSQFGNKQFGLAQAPDMGQYGDKLAGQMQAGQQLGQYGAQYRTDAAARQRGAQAALQKEPLPKRRPQMNPSMLSNG